MTARGKVAADINAAGEGWVQVTLSGVDVSSLTEQQIADAIAQIETVSPPAAISSDKFTREELAQLFPDGIPMIFVKLIFPDLSSALTAGELRQIARALTSPTQAENEARIRAAITPAPDLSAENDIIQEAHEETVYQRFNDLFKRGRAAGGFASETQNLIRELANAMCDAANWRANTKIALKIEQKMRMDIAAENERLLAALDGLRKDMWPCVHDGGFDREIGPIGCLLGDKCVCAPLCMRINATLERKP